VAPQDFLRPSYKGFADHGNYGVFGQYNPPLYKQLFFADTPAPGDFDDTITCPPSYKSADFTGTTADVPNQMTTTPSPDANQLKPRRNNSGLRLKSELLA
jgi:hypothetical protein